MFVSKNVVNKPMNSFMLFAKHERKIIAQENPHKSMFDISTLVGLKWSNLSNAEKDKYIVLADGEKNVIVTIISICCYFGILKQVTLLDVGLELDDLVQGEMIIIIIIIPGQFIGCRKWWFGPHHIKDALTF